MAVHKFKVNLDLSLNQILNVVVENIATLGAGVAGQIAYQTSDNKLYYYDGAANAWVATDGGVNLISASTALLISESPDNTFTLTINDANGTDSGFLSPTFWQMLTDATSLATPNTLVMRDANGGFASGTIDVITHNPLGSSGVTGLSDPVNGTDAVNLNYLNQMLYGLAWKPVAKVIVTNAAVTLSGLQTIQGVPLVTGDIVLLTDQGGTGAPSAHVDNGWYVVDTGAWLRPAWANTGANAVNFTSFVSTGTYADTAWTCISDAAVIGTDPINFAQAASIIPVAYTGGNGIDITANVVSVISALGTLDSTPGLLDVAFDAAGAIDSGTGTGIKARVDGTTITINPSNQLSTGPAIPRIVQATRNLGDLIGPVDITHNLGSRAVEVKVYDVTNAEVTIAVRATALNSITVEANGATAAYRIVIMGGEATIV